MDFPYRISSFSLFKRFFFPENASILVTGYSLDIYKWYFYLTIMISDKNGNFRICLIIVLYRREKKKIEKLEGGSHGLKFLWKELVGWKSLDTTELD
jgi:hypothetical protein